MNKALYISPKGLQVLHSFGGLNGAWDPSQYYALRKLYRTGRHSERCGCQLEIEGPLFLFNSAALYISKTRMIIQQCSLKRTELFKHGLSIRISICKRCLLSFFKTVLVFHTSQELFQCIFKERISEDKNEIFFVLSMINFICTDGPI